MTHDWDNFNFLSFHGDLEKINWNQALQLSQSNIALTFEFYLVIGALQ